MRFRRCSGGLGPRKNFTVCLDVTIAPRSLPYLDLVLRSRLPAQIKYGLDSLLCFSKDGGLRFGEYPGILDTIVEFCLEMLGVGKDIEDPLVQSPFVTYGVLFEAEFTATNTLQPFCSRTLDPVKINREYALVASLILRNASMVAENFSVIGKHEGWKRLVFWSVRPPIPPDLALFISPVDVVITTLSPTPILEHRKNALVSLSSLGHFVELGSQNRADMVLEMCVDFIRSDIYSYAALDCLARLLLNPLNLVHFSGCRHQADLILSLIELLPPSFSLSASSERLAEWELSMLVLSTFIANSTDQSIADVAGLRSRLFAMTKRPPNKSPEAFGQLQGLRERAMKSLLVILNISGAFSASGKFDLEWEQKLLEFSISSHQQGEVWLSVLILEEISI